MQVIGGIYYNIYAIFKKNIRRLIVNYAIQVLLEAVCNWI